MKQGYNYLDHRKLIENIVKVVKVNEAKLQKLTYPLGGPSLSKASAFAETEEQANG